MSYWKSIYVFLLIFVRTCYDAGIDSNSSETIKLKENCLKEKIISLTRFNKPRGYCQHPMSIFMYHKNYIRNNFYTYARKRKPINIIGISFFFSLHTAIQ